MMRLQRNISILEGFGSDRASNVNFSSTKITDKHIQYIINQLVEKMAADPNVTTKPTNKDIEQMILNDVVHISNLATKSPIIYGAQAKNAIESQAFRMLSKFDIEPPSSKPAPIFNFQTFYKLVNFIKSEYTEFFPLRDIKTNRTLKEAYVFVPDSEQSQWNDVNTAAATKDGTFIFNTKFINDLLKFGHIKNIKVNNPKYVSQGGPIPDAWGYIEFLIIHEYLHYTQADWDLSDYYAVDPNISNWVGDFRNNYMLIKNGLPQLPVGLYSPDINYDKQLTFKQMVDAFMKEWGALPEHQQKKISVILDELADDHNQSKSGDDNKSSDDNKSGDGKQNTPSQGDSEPLTKEEKDKAAAAAEERAQQNQSNLGKKQKINPNKSPRTDQLAQSQASPQVVRNIDRKFIPPKFKWNALLKKLVLNSAADPEETYAKPSKKTATQAISLAQRSAAVMKPGEATPEGKLKLVICVDSSGSMSAVINAVYVELESLLKGQTQINNSFIFARFSDGFDMFIVNLRSGLAEKVDSIKSKSKSPQKTNIKQLFSEHIGGGTELSSDICTKLLEAMRNGYYTFLISDTDLIYENNIQYTKQLIVNNKFFLLLGTKDDYVTVISKLGVRDNITYFS